MHGSNYFRSGLKEDEIRTYLTYIEDIGYLFDWLRAPFFLGCVLEVMFFGAHQDFYFCGVDEVDFSMRVGDEILRLCQWAERREFDVDQMQIIDEIIVKCLPTSETFRK